jgi:hypothetical protein
MGLWTKYGLAAPGWLGGPKGPEPQYAALPRPARFRLGLEESRGLFPVFGRFLAGRADLLASPYLHELRNLRLPEPPAAAAPAELTAMVSELRILRSAPGRDVFGGLFRGTPVTIEIFHRNPQAAPQREWELFSRHIRELNDQPESAVTKELVLEQFREWLQAQGDRERKRTLLANLREIPSDSIFQFPKLVPELQSEAWIGYEAAQGEAFEPLLLEPDGATKNLDLLAQGFLEQCLLFSLVDAEFRLEELLLLEGGRLGFRTVPTWLPVPVESHQDLLQYLVAAVGADTPRAVQMLCRISAGRDSYLAEERLLSELSSLQPELKINAITPESVTALETYCRAMAKSSLRPPLFLQMFHRNVTLLGQHNELHSPSLDLMDQALWPVLGRLLRYHLEAVSESGKLQEWAVSSGLFLMTAGRQMAVLLEKLRDSDPRITAESDARSRDSRDIQLNRRTTALLRSGILLVLFLFSLLMALRPDAVPLPVFAGIAAVASAVALWFSVAGIR